MRNMLFSASLLAVCLTIASCTNVYYKMQVGSNSVDSWTLTTTKPTNEILLAFKSSALSTHDLNCTETEEGLKTEGVTYQGKYEGLWPFGDHWDELVQFELKLSAVNKTERRLTVYARAYERPNVYWDWRPVMEFDRTEKLFKEFSSQLKKNLEV